MIRQVNIYNDLGERLTMELDSPERSGLIVTNIEGIGPENANINIDDSSNLDGGIFNSAKRSTRNIVFYLRFWDLPSIETNRQKTYKYFPLKKKIKLEFITDNRQVYTYGYVESNTPNIFSKEEGCSISILCEDPNFYKIDDAYNIVYFSDGVPMFEFPFVKNPIENLEPDSFIFNNTHIYNGYANIINNSDDDIGCTIAVGPFLQAHGYCDGFFILNQTTNKKIILNAFTYSNDYKYLFIESYPGRKKIYLANDFSSSEKINLLNSKDANSDWIYLQRGENILYCSFFHEVGIEYYDYDKNGFVQFPIIYGGI